MMLETQIQPVFRRNPSIPVPSGVGWGAFARPVFCSLVAVAASSAALGQAYFDTRNPFLTPVLPSAPEEPVGTRAGDDFRANERIPYRPTGFDPGSYNLRFGPVLATFSSSLAVAYNSNALQSTGADTSDLNITPSVGTNLRWQITEAARLALSVGVGYRFSLWQDNLDALTISPNTSIDYAFSVGDVLFTVFDRISSASSANQRSDILGTGSSTSVRFNRINNSSGLSADWAPYTDLSVRGDYTYSIERGLDDSYGSLDGQSQSVSAAVFNRLSPAFTVGVSASAALNDFSNGFQNSSKSYGIGPTASWRPSDYLSVSASVRYTVISSDRNGQIQDSSNFGGMTGNLSVSHELNRVLSHSLSVGRGVNGALGSNYSDSINASYQLSWRLTDNLPLNFGVAYDHSKQSGGLQIFGAPPGSIYVPGDPVTGTPSVLVTSSGVFSGVVLTPDGLFGFPSVGQASDNFNFSVSTGYQLTQHLSSSLGYGYTIRNTDFVFGDYKSHIVTLTLTYQF